MSERADLHRAIRDFTDPLAVMRRVVDQALALIAAADGAVVELAGGGRLTCVCAAGTMTGHVGRQLRLDASLSGLAVTSGETLQCVDARVDERVDHDACRQVGLVSMIVVPLLRRDEPVGILKVTAMRPRAFGTGDVRTLTGLADFITAAIAASSDLARVTKALLTGGGSGRSPRRRGPAPGAPPEEWDDAAVSAFVANVLRPGIVEDAEVRGRIEQVLAGSELAIELQPIVNLRSERLVGAEALARFHGPPPQSPDVWFAQAHRVGMGVELELAAVREAVRLVDGLADGVFLAVNVGPETVITGELPAILTRFRDERRIVVELTEHIDVGDYDRLRDALYEIRAGGARLAIDDAGAGFAGLTRILKLAPDLIKLDRELTGGIDLDPVRRSLAAALVSFAAQTGAQIVAEGIETEDELEAVRELGISLGQGYLLGRPGPLDALQRPLAGGSQLAGMAERDWATRLLGRG